MAVSTKYSHANTAPALWMNGGSTGPRLADRTSWPPSSVSGVVGPVPSRLVERELWGSGYETVVGLDEVGRGAWAGPLTVGAAVLPPDRRVYGVRDSKALPEVIREALYDKVAGWCSAWAVGHASPAECDGLGMSEAQRLAAARALDSLGVRPDYVVIDGNWDFVSRPGAPAAAPVRTIVKGDSTCLAIAAASVLAKVTRDRIMRADADSFPAYEFASNKGYPCPRHKKALAGWGPTSIHRLSWAFMDGVPWRPRPSRAEGAASRVDGAAVCASVL